MVCSMESGQEFYNLFLWLMSLILGLFIPKKIYISKQDKFYKICETFVLRLINFDHFYDLLTTFYGKIKDDQRLQHVFFKLIENKNVKVKIHTTTIQGFLLFISLCSWIPSKK